MPRGGSRGSAAAISIGSIATRATARSSTSRRRPASPMSKTRARRRGAISTAMETWICTSASRGTRRCRTSCIATPVMAGTLPRSATTWVSISSARRGRSVGSITTTTEGSICSSRSATGRTPCSTTKGTISATWPGTWASPIRERRSAPSGSTWTRTAGWICSSRTRTATTTASSITRAAGSWISRQSSAWTVRAGPRCTAESAPAWPISTTMDCSIFMLRTTDRTSCSRISAARSRTSRRSSGSRASITPSVRSGATTTTTGVRICM